MQLFRALLRIALVVLSAIFFFIGLSGQDYYVAILPLLVLFGVYLVSNIEKWFVLTMLLYFTQIHLPGTPAQLSLFQIMASSSFVATIVARSLKRRWVLSVRSPVDLWVVFFLVTVGFVAIWRGVGVRFMGSQLWGGATYVVIFTSAMFFFVARQTVLSSKTWRRSVLWMYGLAVLPTIAHVAYVVSGGVVRFQYYFIQTAGAFGVQMPDDWLSRTLSGDEVTRYRTGCEYYFAAVPFLVIRQPFRFPGILGTILCMLIAFSIAGFSGYRGGVILLLLLPIVWALMGKSRLNWFAAAALAFSALAALGLMAAFAPLLPISFQRALSFVPFAHIAHEARLSAASTAEWRLDVWRDAINYIPDYLWIGKGFAFDPRRLTELLSTGFYTRDWAHLTSHYHNGPLGLLIVFGVSGFLSGMAIILGECWFFWKILYEEWRDGVLRQVYRCLLAFFTAHLIMFLTIYGDVDTSMPVFFVIGGLLYGVILSKRENDRKLCLAKEQPPLPKHALENEPGVSTSSDSPQIQTP